MRYGTIFNNRKVRRLKEAKFLSDEDYLYALAEFLNIDPEDVTKENFTHYGLPVFSAKSDLYDINNFAMGEEGVVDAAAELAVKDNIYLVDSSFIAEETGVPEEMIKLYIEHFHRPWKANGGLVQLVKRTCGLKKFTDDALEKYGRGYFLSGPGEEEYEKVVEGGRTVYIYGI